MQKFDDLRSTVASLYAIMNVEEYKAFRERILVEEYENVKAELKPLVQVCLFLEFSKVFTSVKSSSFSWGMNLIALLNHTFQRGDVRMSLPRTLHSWRISELQSISLYFDDNFRTICFDRDMINHITFQVVSYCKIWS